MSKAPTNGNIDLNKVVDFETLNMPRGQIAYVQFNGTDDDGQDFWHLYHRINGVATWGTVLPVDSKEEAVTALRAAIERGEAEKVAKQVVTVIS